MTPPTAEGGALRSQDARTTSDPTGLDGALLRVDPDTGAGLPGNPLRRRSADANQRRIVAFGLPQPVPLHRPPRAPTRSGSATSAGAAGRRSTASLDPSDSRSRQPRLALLRGRRARAAMTAPTSTSARRLYAPGDAATSSRPTSPTTTQRQGRRRRELPDRELLDRGPRLLRRRRLPELLRRRPLLRRLLPRLHLGDAAGRERPPEPVDDPDLRRGRREPGRRSRSTRASSSTRTSTAARSSGSPRGRQPVPDRGRDRDPLQRPGPARPCS